MEVYTLDSVLRRASVVDTFESCIWTERFAESGDFEMSMFSTFEMRNLLQVGTRLAMNESTRVMQIETAENTADSEGREMIKLSGRSLESIMESRVNRRNFGSGEAVDDSATRIGTAAQIARGIFDDYCRNNTVFPQDNIPFLVSGSLYPPSTIPEAADSITMEIKIDSVYNTVTEICKATDMGYRLVREFDLSKLYFDIYTGNNRTTQQTTNKPVVFSPNLDNLKDTSELLSNENYRNVAYVFAKNASVIVYAANVDSTVTGFQRRVLFVDAMDITDAAGPALTTKLNQRGQQELSKHRSVSAFDGEVPQFGTYKYGVDYELGDIVELQNADGVAQNMRVTEQIFVSDEQGERSYPTLSQDLYVTPGSWLAWDPSATWSTAGALFWADA